MQTEVQKNRTETEEMEKIDLIGWMQDYLSCLKQFWLQFLLVVVIVVGLVVSYYEFLYEPVYSAKITYAASGTEYMTVNSDVAKRLSMSIRILGANEKFKEDLLAAVDGDIKGVTTGDFSVTSTNTEESNFFSVTLKTGHASLANPLLEAFEEVYPKWVSKSNGTVELQIVDKAMSTGSPINPSGTSTAIFRGLLAGVVVCVIIATIYLLGVQTVRRESDMKKLTSARCMSCIPEVITKKRSKNKKPKILITNKRMDWGFKQTILMIQSRLQQQMLRAGDKVLLVTSTIPEEGKTMTSVNLALAFALDGKKVALLDGDLRKPSIGEMLGVPEGPGLTEYFAGKKKAEEICIMKNKIAFYQGGMKKGKVSSLINEEKMRALIEELKAQYDIVLIDAAPAYAFSDASILSSYAERVLYVVRADKAQLREIQNGISSFDESGKLIGYVINRDTGDFAARSDHSYGYGRYGKYSRYSRYGKYGRYGKYQKYRKYAELDEESMNTEDTL